MSAVVFRPNSTERLPAARERAAASPERRDEGHDRVRELLDQLDPHGRVPEQDAQVLLRDQVEVVERGVCHRRAANLHRFEHGARRQAGCVLAQALARVGGMNDLRAFFDGDARWLSHYGFSPLEVPTLSAGVGSSVGAQA